MLESLSLEKLLPDLWKRRSRCLKGKEERVKANSWELAGITKIIASSLPWRESILQPGNEESSNEKERSPVKSGAEESKSF